MIENSKIEAIAVKAFTDHRDGYISMKQKWNELYERYENKLRDNSITAKTASKVCLGGAFSLVENAIPRLLGRDPKYKYMGREGDDEQAAELYDQFSEYQFEMAHARRELRYVVNWGLICGLAGWKMGWQETKKMVSKDGKEILGKQVTNELFIKGLEKLKMGKDIKVDEEMTEAGYTFKAIKPQDLIWNTQATSMEDVKVFGHKDRSTIIELEQAGFETNKLVSSLGETDYWMNKLKLADGVNEVEKAANVQDAIKMTEVEIAELYVKALNDRNVWESHVVWIACVENGSPTVVRTEKNPYDKKFIPMGIFRPVDRVGKFYGFGIIEPSIGAIDAEEDTLNMNLEALWTATVPPIEYNPNNILNVNALEYGPRSLTAVRQLGQSMAVMPTPQPNIQGANFLLDYLNRAKQNISAVTDYQTGSDQVGGAKTLGEIQIKTQESNARMSQMLVNFEQMVIEPMGKYALWMNQQFLVNNKEMFFRVMGRKGSILAKKLKFKDIEAIKDIVVVSGSSALVIQRAELQKWSALLSAVYLEEQSVDPVKINKLPIWERLFEQGLLIKDPETYIPSLKEIEEAEVGGDEMQLQDAKDENDSPLTARVLPTDNPEIHIPVHQAEIQRRKKELDMAQANGIEVPPEVIEELQLLVKHLDDHTMTMQGPVPEHSQAMQVGQGVNPAMQPNETQAA